MGVVIVEPTSAEENLSDITLAEIRFIDKVKFYLHYVTLVHWLPSSLSEVSCGVYLKATVLWQVTEMKWVISLNNITDFSGFEHRWKHMG